MGDLLLFSTNDKIAKTLRIRNYHLDLHSMGGFYLASVKGRWGIFNRSLSVDSNDVQIRVECDRKVRVNLHVHRGALYNRT